MSFQVKYRGFQIYRAGQWDHEAKGAICHEVDRRSFVLTSSFYSPRISKGSFVVSTCWGAFQTPGSRNSRSASSGFAAVTMHVIQPGQIFNLSRAQTAIPEPDFWVASRRCYRKETELFDGLGFGTRILQMPSQGFCKVLRSGRLEMCLLSVLLGALWLVLW